MSAYRLPSPYERPPLQRRASGIALAIAVNVGLLLILLGLNKFAPVAVAPSRTLVVDFEPESRSAQAPTRSEEQRKPVEHQKQQPVPKPPKIVLPAKPTITPAPEPAKPSPWIEMSKADLAAADISNVARSGASFGHGDSEVVGHGPNGETLYAAEWARHPSDAELGGYLPHGAPDGYGLVACKTMPENRVDDCIDLEEHPLGSHLARAIRQAAWQFRVRPPRKNGVPLIGSWVRIRIDYESIRPRDSDARL